MTSNLDVVKAFLERAWEDVPSSLVEASQDTLSDDFQSVDSDGNPVMNKEAYIGAGQMMAASLEGFKWVLSDLRQEGDDVIMTGHFEGTHTRDIDLSAFGAGVIPASGKKVVWPETSVRWVVEDDKIMREEALDESSGIEAFLAPLGVKPPSA
jgi:predicted ester cyclase